VPWNNPEPHSLGFSQDVGIRGFGGLSRRTAVELGLGQRGARMGVLGTIGNTMGGWDSLLQGVSAGVMNIYNAKAQAKMLRQYNRMLMLRGQLGAATGNAPGGVIMGGVPAANPGLMFGGGGGGGWGLSEFPSLPDIAGGVFGGIGDAAVSLGERILAPSPAARTRAPRLVGSVNNATGKAVFYRYVGAPILFRGDLTTLKTVRKAVSKFGGLAGARRTFRRRR
jgi:hypothetical protein